MDQDFARLPIDREIEQDVLVDSVVVEEVVRTVLIEPDRFAGIDIARENP